MSVATGEETTVIRMSQNQKDNLVAFNIRGIRFLLEKSTLESLPEESGFATKLQESFGVSIAEIKSGQARIEELYLNRNPALFHYIADYLDTNVLHFPHNICIKMIKNEMLFWGFHESALSKCCWQRLAKDHTNKMEQIEIARYWAWLERKPRQVAEKLPGGKTRFKTPIREQIRLFLEDAGSSIPAKVWAIFLTFIIVLSLLTLVLETEQSLRYPAYNQVIKQTNITEGEGLYEYYIMHSDVAEWVGYMALVCLCILTLEYLVRFVVSYHKLCFLIHPLNIADLLSILPMWGLFAVNELRDAGHTFSDRVEKTIMFLIILRLFRIFRFIRLMSYSKQLKIIYVSVIRSYRQIIILACLMALLSITFGSAMYYAELKVDNFSSILIGQWWAIITMTTVGYGDFYPKTPAGYCIGVLCSVTGIVHIALATTVIVNNFIKTTEAVDKFLRNERRNTKVAERKAIHLWNEQAQKEADEDDDDDEDDVKAEQNGTGLSHVEIAETKL